jgi:CubicO group peptidase (beta-lactamase class C family)
MPFLFTPWLTAFLSLVATSLLAGPDDPYPADAWRGKPPTEAGLDDEKLKNARDYALSGGGSGFIIHRGFLVMQWGDPAKRYDLKSTTKSIGFTAVGLAVQDGKLTLSDKAAQHHPQFGIPPDDNAKTGWLDEITLRHLATQTAGFEKPGGYGKLLFKHGAKWCYSDGGPNWLAECVTLAYKRDLDELLFERVFGPLGISRDDLVWRKNSYRPHEIGGVMRREFGSGISANVDAMARFGYLYLRNGKWNDKQIIPADFVSEVRTTKPDVVGLEELDDKQHGNASDHYGLLWWNNADGTLDTVPRDAYWSWGLYDSLIVVVPSLDLVVARAGASWQRKEDADHYDVLKPFLEPIALAVRDRTAGDTSSRKAAPLITKRAAAPYPSSTVITAIGWAPAGTIVRLAPGSDTWPLTWASDDHLYTAYGDGRGFRPFMPAKLSLGLARISGSPPEILGTNLPAPSIEHRGDGAAGRKASGILMVHGVLYLWARNVGNSQLAWSKDSGRTWTWADWKFSDSFGCPTFLNFGRNYEGARDRYVYVYSHDHNSAYQPADRMVKIASPTARLTSSSPDSMSGKCRDGHPTSTAAAPSSSIQGTVIAQASPTTRR